MEQLGTTNGKVSSGETGPHPGTQEPDIDGGGMSLVGQDIIGLPRLKPHQERESFDIFASEQLRE